MSGALLELHDLSFQRGETAILSKINWSLHSGEHWTFLGPNGAGKSTMAALILGYEWPTSGLVERRGRSPESAPVHIQRQGIGWFQPSQMDRHAIYHPDATVLEIILTGADATLAPYRDYSAEEQARASELFRSAFGQNRLFDGQRLFALLSTGERRKTLLLRALMAVPWLLLLDEPYESLDLPSRYELEMLLSRHAADRFQVINIVHRVDEIPAFCTHVLMLKAGRVYAQGPIDQVLNSETLSELYGLPLQLHRNGRRFATTWRESS
ncbi:MAG: ATP-binding cassette domain-containing protein [Leptospirales bacterium]|nr:ATP-binding cassette domain-containing protein [Leptospirales bacterium]